MLVLDSEGRTVLCRQTSAFIYNTSDIYIYTVRQGEEGFQGYVQGWDTCSHSTSYSPNPDFTQSTQKPCSFSLKLNRKGSREDRFRFRFRKVYQRNTQVHRELNKSPSQATLTSTML